MSSPYTTAQHQAADDVDAAELAYGHALEAAQAAEAAHLAALDTLRAADAERQQARAAYRAQFDGKAANVFAVRAAARRNPAAER